MPYSIPLARRQHLSCTMAVTMPKPELCQAPGGCIRYVWKGGYSQAHAGEQKLCQQQALGGCSRCVCEGRGGNGGRPVCWEVGLGVHVETVQGKIPPTGPDHSI